MAIFPLYAPYPLLYVNDQGNRYSYDKHTYLLFVYRKKENKKTPLQKNIFHILKLLDRLFGGPGNKADAARALYLT